MVLNKMKDHAPIEDIFKIKIISVVEKIRWKAINN